MRGTVVLASYNESRAIRHVLAEIDEAALVLRRAGIDLDIVLVDDASPDGTPDHARDEAARLGLPLSVLSGSREGPGRAVLRGLQHALAGDPAPDFLVTLDADGQHDARQIPDLVRAFLARDSGITIGSRWVRGGSSPGTSPARSVLSRVANVLVALATGVRGVHDTTTSFRVIRPEVARRFTPGAVKVQGYGFYSAFVAFADAAGFRIDEVPITFRPRYAGVSKLETRDLVEFLQNLPRMRRETRKIRRQSGM